MGIDIIGPLPLGGDRNLALQLDQVGQLISGSKARSTVGAYRADWRDFCAWTDSHGLAAIPAPPEAVAAYIAALAGRLKVATIERRLNAIAEAHKSAGVDSPTPLVSKLGQEHER